MLKSFLRNVIARMKCKAIHSTSLSRAGRNLLSYLSLVILLFLSACTDYAAKMEDDFEEWEIKPSALEIVGGGYFEYTVNGDGFYTIKLEKDDVEPPFRVNNSHRYFYFCTQIEESERGDQISLMVAAPQTGKDLIPVARASLNGRYQYVTWMREQFSPEAPLIAEKSTIRFDEIIGDSLWTAHLELYFKDCRSGVCIDSLPPVHISGRLRYWVPDSER